MVPGILKQCSICGKVFACGGYSITLSDLDGVLDDLHYPKVCPTCYALVLRTLVVREQEGKRRTVDETLRDAR